MVDRSLNMLSVVGHDLLLVEVGGGWGVHLAEATDGSDARAALDPERPAPVGDNASRDLSLVELRWKPSTLCGRTWDEMVAGEASGAFRRWQEVALTPTCRSCLRVVDTWFPRAELPAGAGVLVAVIGDTVAEFTSAWVTSVPAEHLESLRSAVRRHLRNRGFRSQTVVANGVLHVMSGDALAAIDPAVKEAWVARAVGHIGLTDEDESASSRPQLGVDWHTWVLDT